MLSLHHTRRSCSSSVLHGLFLHPGRETKPTGFPIDGLDLPVSSAGVKRQSLISSSSRCTGARGRAQENRRRCRWTAHHALLGLSSSASRSTSTSTSVSRPPTTLSRERSSRAHRPSWRPRVRRPSLLTSRAVRAFRGHFTAKEHRVSRCRASTCISSMSCGSSWTQPFTCSTSPPCKPSPAASSAARVPRYASRPASLACSVFRALFAPLAELAC